jgi:hypothetical protein
MNFISCGKIVLNIIIFLHLVVLKWVMASLTNKCGVGTSEAAKHESKRYLLRLLERPRLQASLRDWGMSFIVETVENLQ